VIDQLAQVAEWIGKARRGVVALTGAGISTESGIPDFRGPKGVWTRDPAAEKLSNLHYYMSDPAVRVAAWKSRLDHPAWSARPNDGHRALAELEGKGHLHTLVTQNIDGLHQAAGSQKVLELHGSIRLAKCLSCGRRTPMQEQLDRVRAGDPDPACTECGGIQKSATVAFGEQLDPLVLETAVVASSACDLFLVIGTTLTVQPAALLAAEAQRRGARLVIVNQGETPLDDRADAVLRDPIGEVLPEIVGCR
jgi:NAD-dependent deacetylase